MHRILLTGASRTLGRNFLELSGNDPNLEILVLLLSESRFHSKICTDTGWMPQVSRVEGVSRTLAWVQESENQ